MKKVVILISTSLLVCSSLVGCKKKTDNKPITNDVEYEIVLDKDSQLEAGEIEKEGISFHFDENSVNEHPIDSFIEIGPYGSLYLENYIQGLSHVSVTAKHTVDYSGEFFLGRSSTPNSVEKFYLYSTTSSSISLNNDNPYFSIHNRAGSTLLIDKVVIQGSKLGKDIEPLRKLIQVSDKVVRYNITSPYDPYEGKEINPSDIPSNRVVKKINEGQTYVKPGKYTYGYEVYNKDENGNIGKMLYSSIAEVSIQGSRLNNNHLAIFHKPNEDIVLEVANHQKVDISQSYSIRDYNWDSPVNDFETPFYADRHYYPVFSVVGIPSRKNGDGCYPVSTTYTLLEKTFVLPEPTMMSGYKFGGWYMDHDLTIPYDPDGEYVGDVTLYANCIETDQNFKKIYYHDYDGTFLNRIDFLYEGESVALPTFEDIKTSLKANELMYEVRMGTNRIGMLMPEHTYDNIGHYNGDRLSYDMVKTYDGDVHLYVSKFEFYYDGPAQYTRLFEDSEHNTVVSGYQMSETYHDGDFILPGRYVQINKSTWQYDFNTYSDPTRSDEFLVTDEVHGYIVDQGLFTSISTYGYGNKSSMYSKPLSGILRHESVLKVGRRAFFNRYGLEGTYFPRNAREFDVESYANTTFNDVLLLPKSLQKIGPRAFMGSKNIKYVALPKSLTSVGAGAFSLGTYDEETFTFKNIRIRNTIEEGIIFYYEGTEEEFNRLDEDAREEIENNAIRIVFNYQYNPRYAK